MKGFDIAAINERFPTWLEKLGATLHWLNPEHFQCNCPFHDDRKRKFDATKKPDGTWVGKCWNSGCPASAGGDALRLYQDVCSVDFGTAGTRLSQELGLPFGVFDNVVRQQPHRLGSGNEERHELNKRSKRATWPPFVESLIKGCENLATLRRIPIEGIRLAHTWGTLRFTHWRDQPCWVLLSHDGTCAEVRRMDGKTFFGDFKAIALPGSEKKHCLLGEHLLGSDPDPCFLVEGGPDWLSASWLARFARCQVGAPNWVPLGFLGAECSFTAAQLQKLRGRLIRVFVHADAAGRKGSDRWADALIAEGCTVDLVHIGRLGLFLPEGTGVKDLNDALVGNSARLEQFGREAVTV